MASPVYKDSDKAYEARRAGLLPADPEADKKVEADRKKKADDAAAEAKRREAERRAKAGR